MRLMRHPQICTVVKNDQDAKGTTKALPRTCLEDVWPIIMRIYLEVGPRKDPCSTEFQVGICTSKLNGAISAESYEIASEII